MAVVTASHPRADCPGEGGEGGKRTGEGWRREDKRRVEKRGHYKGGEERTREGWRREDRRRGAGEKRHLEIF